MANPHPIQTPAFLAQQKPKYGDQPLGDAIGVRFPAKIDAVLRQQNNRQQLIREAVELYLKNKGLL